jgi:SNF2 family DNA or RNA helicase
MTLELRAYQREDVGRMADVLASGGVCWNLSEMRTGKLIEMIALCRTLESQHSVLIVAPLSTLLNVQDEFKRWTGWFVSVNLDRSQFFTADQPKIWAINKEKLRDRDHWVFNGRWDLVMIDEAHHFRGRRSAQTKGAFRLQARARKLVLATGTPLVNGLPREVWPLLHLTDPKKWSSFWRFMEQHAARVPGWNGASQDESAPWTKAGKAAIQEYLAPLVVRRTYAEVRPELPPVVEQTIRLDLETLDPQHWSGYKQLEAEWRVQVGDTTLDVPTLLTLTTRLRQYAASPRNVLPEAGAGGKVAAIVEWAADQSGKGIIWCWHRAMATAICDALVKATEDRVVWIDTLTGGDGLDERANTVREFQSVRRIPAFLIATIGALKEGISLDTASWECFAEKSWVPSDNDQAAARIQGPNQTGSPLVVSFVCAGPIEEKIERVLAKKDGDIASFMMLKELIDAEYTGPFD